MIGVTTFANAKVTDGKFAEQPWDVLADAFANPPTTSADKLQQPLFRLARFADDSRANGSPPPHTIWGIEADYDGGIVTLEAAAGLLQAAGVEAVLFTTARHTPERPRWRVVASASTAYPHGDRADLLGRANTILGGILSPESWDESRCYFAGRLEGVEFTSARTHGACIDMLPITPTVPEAKATPRERTKAINWAKDKPMACWALAVLVAAEHAGTPSPYSNDHDSPPDGLGWLAVGQALHHGSGGSADALEMWETFSAEFPASNTDGQERKTCAYAWASFDPQHQKPRTIGTLLKFAGTAWKTLPDTEQARLPHPGSAAAPAEWPEPMDFWVQGDVPALPRGVLPAVLDTMVWHLRDVSGFAPEFTAMAGLGVLAAGIPVNVAVYPKRGDYEWAESATLWVMLYGPPSVKKSPVLKRLYKPARQVAVGDNEQHKREMAQWLARKKAAGKDFDVAADPAPAKRHVLVTDATNEAISEVLKHEVNRHGRLLLACDEGVGFITGTGYNGAALVRELGDRMEGYSAEPRNILRIGRGEVYCPVWNFGCIGSSQPETLKAAFKRLPNAGMLQRFFWIEGVATPDTEMPTDHRIVGAFDSAVLGMYELPVDQHRMIHFAPDAAPARRAFADYCDRMVTLLQHDEPLLASHFGKWSGMFARICLVFHMTENSAADDISLDVARRVTRLFREFLVPQTFRFYRMLGAGTADTDIAPVTARRVAQTASAILRYGITVATTTALHRRLRFWRDADIPEKSLILNALVDAGWLAPRVVTDEQGRSTEEGVGRGRPTAWAYDVNPAVHDGRFIEQRQRLQDIADAHVEVRNLPTRASN